VSDPPPLSLVIFDCDGVLVDSEPIALRLLLETLDEAGLPLDPEEAHARFLGRSLASTREILAQDYGIALTDDALAEMRRRLYAAFRAELRPIPGIAEALDALPAPYCVASSSQPERIELSLTVAGLWPCFRGRAFSATMVSRGKPAPDLFLFAADCLGYAPTTCLVVEDSPAGISAAKAAGMRVVAFTGGSHATTDAHRSAIAALGPEAVIDDIRALVGLCGTGPAP
jgi:HAD superfamily hydrolase (TIGR01509 family)